MYLPAVLLVYYLVPVKYRNIWLFVVNLVFYGWGEPVYIGLMVFSICLNYVAGLLIEKYRDSDRKKAKCVLVINTVINLGMLVFFKYFDMLLQTVSLIPGIDIAPLGLSLPIGISFYTFQTMSYPIDLYRGDCDVQRNFINFGTFVGLFPQLIAGPIVRYRDVASQLSFRATSAESFAYGIERFVIGLGKKVLIANNIGALWDACAAQGSSLSFFGSWLGAVAFSLQIYFDFSGYSDMAIGLGRMLGFEFLENFNYPYISTSLSEFWRRWHISLGSWFRDYLYIPLGGNRVKKYRRILNLIIVWAATGIWHGASWTFIIWGLYYGFFIILEKQFYGKWLDKKHHAIGRIYTVVLVVTAWPIFQLASLKEGIPYYKAMFGFGGAGVINSGDIYNLRSYLVILIIGIIAATPLGKKVFERIPAKAKTVLVPVMVLFVLVISTAYLVDATYNPFLYFRF
jgi:alginate O-acetyltransferase complex protein AlgI